MTTSINPHSPLTRRIEMLQTDKLSTNEIVVLVQDIIDAEEVFNWGQNVYNLVVHCCKENLCTLRGKYAWREAA